MKQDALSRLVWFILYIYIAHLPVNCKWTFGSNMGVQNAHKNQHCLNSIVRMKKALNTIIRAFGTNWVLYMQGKIYVVRIFRNLYHGH